MRYKCRCIYDGTLFRGFQTQENVRTVQGEIERVLRNINNADIVIHPSGRTDAGVHALDQVFHFDSVIDLDEERYRQVINYQINKDIYISKMEKVSEDFHSRHNAISKEYHYYIDFGEFNPLLKNYRYYCSFKNIDREKFIDAFSVYIGTHDFRSFTKAQSKKDTIRTIYSIECEEKDNLIIIKFVGNGFLYNMVRILVAMALEVGKGKYSKDELKSIMEAKNRILAPKNAPPNGLYLYKVNY